MAEQIQYSAWEGIDTRRPDFDIPKTLFRNATNVDILSTGRVRRRRGITQVIADPNAHSVFSDGVRLIYATPTTLKLVQSNFAAATLLSDARLNKPLSYVEVNGDVYFSNEKINGKINAAGAYEPWGIVPPPYAPIITKKGATTETVQVTCTFVTATGEESGAPLAVALPVGENVLVSGIPQSTDSRVTTVRIYATELNGRDLFQAADVPAGVTSVTINSPFAKGALLETQFMQPPPPGQLLEYLQGRIFIASGSNVYFTEPLRYGCYDPEANFYMAQQRVTLLRAVNDGLYIGADTTVFVTQAGTEEALRTPVVPYSAVEGAAMTLPDGVSVMWLSDRGFIVGGNGGQIKPVTEATIAMPMYAFGCMGLIENDGHKHAVTILAPPKPSAYVSKDFIVADATRRNQLK